VTDDVPAGASASLREDGVAAGDVFFGVNGVEFVGCFVFVRNGEKTDTMDRTCSSAEFGIMKTKLIPGEIDKVKKYQHGEDENDESTPRKAGSAGDFG
jgi:hypothetical protein